MEEMALLIRVALGSMLLLSGLVKARRRIEFAESVQAYRVVPLHLVGPAAVTVLVSEIAIGIALLAGVLAIPAATGAAGLLLIFALAMAINLVRGRRIECGCLGMTEHERISWGLVARNVAMAGAALIVALGPPTSLSVQGTHGAMSTSDSWLLTLSALLTIVLGLSWFAFIRAAQKSRHVLGVAP